MPTADLDTLSLEVEIFAGSHLNRVCPHLCALADKFSLTVTGKMNGVTLMAVPGDQPDKLVNAYLEAVATRRPVARGGPA